jgi:hypothetical protein
MGLTREQEAWLNSCPGWAYLKAKWTFNEETGLVDVDGDFKTPASHHSCQALGRSGKGKGVPISDFKGIKFGRVKGDFDCSYNNLESLDGAPQEVLGGFYCSYNKLKSLEGGPKYVRRGYRCQGNNLINLVGAPEYVGGNFSCSENKFVDLSGAELCMIGGEFHSDISFTPMESKIIDTRMLPRLVRGQFNCYLGDTKYKRTRVKTFDLIEETMNDTGFDCFHAILYLKSKIDKPEWNRLTAGFEKHISPEVIKGVSMLGRFLNP